MKIFLISAMSVFFITSITLAGYSYKKNETLQSTLANFASTTLAYDMKIEELNREKEEIENDYEKEKKKNNKFEEQLDDIADSVNDLEKLKKIDKELLQKYSKIYFLNEHYNPDKLVPIKSKYIALGKNPQLFHSEAVDFLEEMFDAAKDDGLDLRVVSSYRSFATQSVVKANHKVIYGSGANQFSADQGYSEHQLGTTIDLTTANLGTAGFEKIAIDPAYVWLTNNAHKFGFILSYPKNNKYYIFEPWHWRFVGTDLAEDLHDDKLNFYDMDQRKIDSYLIKLFD